MGLYGPLIKSRDVTDVLQYNKIHYNSHSSSIKRVGVKQQMNYFTSSIFYKLEMRGLWDIGGCYFI